jgi:2-polyprenyl-6-methoxyphenol hydroxylase-like FAD-dependent oxidoreductase
MDAPDVVIAGGGPAGLAAALALARSGARITLVERDRMDARVEPADAFRIARDGIAHFDAPHAFLPRGAKVLRERARDVYDTLLDLGALELQIARDQPDSRPDDEELILLCVRRPLIEWALRDAVLREALVDVVTGRVESVVLDGGRVVGLATTAGEVRAPLVVDAMGRTSRARRWLDVPEDSHEVGIVYYSRYFQLHDGLDFPPCANPFGPRVDLGYALAASFIGDNSTFAIALMVPSWDRELKAALREPDRFVAACATLPQTQGWVDPEVSRPITGVGSMGALQTTWRAYEREGPAGFVAVADAFCHTDPGWALGLSLGLVHGFALADAGGDVDAFWGATVPELRERFELARDVAAARLARLRGEQVPSSVAAATFSALFAAALDDPDLFRVAYRRQGFLDRLTPLDGLPEPPPSPPPALSREELLGAIRAA